MATKGPSNQYGHSRGSFYKKPSKHIFFKYATEFLEATLMDHYLKHGKEFDAISPKDYENKAIRFANFIDRKNCKSIIDCNKTTYKYNPKTRELVIVTKKGIVVNYYIISSKTNGFSYKKKGGEEVWVKI